MEQTKTYLWWKFLCVIAIINIGIWCWAFFAHADMQGFSIAQPVLSGIYVIVCAFRSFYPRIDLERYCLHDTPLSSVVLGRLCATIAEVCFSAQCAIIVYELGQLLGSPIIQNIALVIIPIIVLAQVFCWYATLTLKHFWHGMEELAWVVMVVLAAGCFGYGFTQITGPLQLLMVLGVISCLGCGYIMLFVDIPMYFAREKNGKDEGLTYLTVGEGVQDALYRRVQTCSWSVWKKEVVWITSYFTFGVWLSIGMIFVDFGV